MKRILLGHFRPGELPKYLAAKALLFWGTIALCWWLYPTENRYSIMSHTFSFLGSFSTDRNPQWWWLFTLAMLFWSAAMFPLIAYTYRRFRHISPLGAAIGAFFFALGSAAIALVGLFPDVSTPMLGTLSWTQVHEVVAILVAVGFILGILWHAALLAYSRFLVPHRTSLRHRRFIPPYTLWSSVLAIAAYNQISWDLQYRALKAQALAEGRTIRSSWGESINTIYAFPLWENIVIYTLFAFLLWFTLALPHDPRPKAIPS